MSNNASSAPWVFSLGGIPFTVFEVPQEFTLGHEASITVHKYFSPSGRPTKKLQSLGAFAPPTSWKGIFYYATALDRANALDKLCIAQNLIKWVYGPFEYMVLIRKFIPKVIHQFEIQYDIELEIQSEKNGTQPAANASASFPEATQSFFNTTSDAMDALDADDAGAEAAALFTEFTTVNTQLVASAPLTGASFSTLSALLATCESFYNHLVTYTTAMEASATLENDIAALNNALVALQGFGLFTQNIEQLTGANSSNSQTISGFVGDLFTLAAQFYPDASGPDTVVESIANSNNLSDYYVNTATDIVLPPVFE